MLDYNASCCITGSNEDNMECACIYILFASDHLQASEELNKERGEDIVKPVMKSTSSCSAKSALHNRMLFARGFQFWFVVSVIYLLYYWKYCAFL